MNAYALMRVLSAISLTTVIAGCDGDDGRPEGVWDPGTDEAEPVQHDDGGGGGGGDSGAGDDGGSGEATYDCPEPATKCEGWNGTPPKVELRIFDIDDVVMVDVNGLRRGFYSIPNTPSRDTGRMDITRWFSRGSNDLRIIAANTGGPADASVEVWIDGVQQSRVECSDTTCNGGDVAQGVFLDQVFDISSESFPCAQQVCVYGEEEGQIYVDGFYTPYRAPGQLMLPAESWHSISVGSGTDDPPPGAGEGFVHEGRLRTETVWVPDGPMELDISRSALATPSEYKLLIVPIHGIRYKNGDVGILPEGAAEILVPAIERTSRELVMPFTYGQAKWSAEIHPTIEVDVTLDPGAPLPIDHNIAFAAGLDKTKVDAANVTVWLYSTVDAHGQPVREGPCCWWGGRNNEIWVPTNGTFDGRIVPYLLAHEWLHTLEDDLARMGYAGVGGVHGSGAHGYNGIDNGELDFAQFYRHWMRGAVEEAGTYVGAITPLWLLGFYSSAPLPPPTDLAAAEIEDDAPVYLNRHEIIGTGANQRRITTRVEVFEALTDFEAP